MRLRIIRLVKALPHDNVSWNVEKQLLKAGTSVGANYREAQRASSRAHFVSILQIALREADETQWWLELINESETLPRPMIVDILKESDEIIRILTAAVKSSKES